VRVSELQKERKPERRKWLTDVRASSGPGVDGDEDSLGKLEGQCGGTVLNANLDRVRRVGLGERPQEINRLEKKEEKKEEIKLK